MIYTRNPPKRGMEVLSGSAATAVHGATAELEKQEVHIVRYLIHICSTSSPVPLTHVESIQGKLVRESKSDGADGSGGSKCRLTRPPRFQACGVTVLLGTDGTRHTQLSCVFRVASTYSSVRWRLCLLQLQEIILRESKTHSCSL